MADFLTAFKITGINEGGYAFNHNDAGKETYCGIARKFWPNWAGWPIIDEAKTHVDNVIGLDMMLSKNSNIQSMIDNFYKQNFWDVNKLDLINDQQLANNIYDFGVNSGTGEAAKTLQLNAGVTQDGIIGTQTLNTVNNYNAEAIYNAYNNSRKLFYIELSKKPGQLQFLNSWLSRLKPYQTT